MYIAVEIFTNNFIKAESDVENDHMAKETFETIFFLLQRVY